MAAAEKRHDHAGLPETEPDMDRAVEAAVAWLARAQDASLSNDGGVARHYSLLDGWSASYPETTGYIIPTMLNYAKARSGASADEARERARRMADWLVSIQLPKGGFQGGMVDQTPVVPVTFNTGQILMGLAAAASEFGDDYLEPMNRAARWLVDTQDADGCWRRFPTPFAAPGEKAYETHVAWGVLEADRVNSDPEYRRAAIANIDWALRSQHANGWFEKCCLQDPRAPLTHTLGYVLRGILEGYRTTQDPALLAAAQRTADGLLSALQPRGFLPGRLNVEWQGTVRWACLTGTVQVAYCWLMLFSATGDSRYYDAARLANRYVGRTLHLTGSLDTRGGVKGSFPVDGDYGKFQYLNWAPKFFIDSALLEKEIVSQAGSGPVE